MGDRDSRTGIQHRDRDNRAALQKAMSLSSRQEHASVLVQDIEFHKVMGQQVVKDRMLGIYPLTVHYISGAKHFPQDLFMSVGPRLEQIEVSLPRAPIEEMSPA